MSTEIVVADDLWDPSIEEAVVTTWFFDDGASVTAGTVVAEVMANKTQVEVAAPASGVLRIRAPVDTVVRRGASLATIEAPG